MPLPAVLPTARVLPFLLPAMVLAGSVYLTSHPFQALHSVLLQLFHASVLHILATVCLLLPLREAVFSRARASCARPLAVLAAALTVCWRGPPRLGTAPVPNEVIFAFMEELQPR